MLQYLAIYGDRSGAPFGHVTACCIRSAHWRRTIEKEGIMQKKILFDQDVVVWLDYKTLQTFQKREVQTMRSG